MYSWSNGKQNVVKKSDTYLVDNNIAERIMYIQSKIDQIDSKSDITEVDRMRRAILVNRLRDLMMKIS